MTDAGVPEPDIKNSDFELSAHIEQLYRRHGDSDDYYVSTSEVHGYEYDAHLFLHRDPSQEEAMRIWAALASCGDDVFFYFSYCP